MTGTRVDMWNVEISGISSVFPSVLRG